MSATKIRLSTARANTLFNEHGVQLTERWSNVDFDKLSLADRAGIVRGRNHYLQVHPDDDEKFSALAAQVAQESAAIGVASDETRASRGPTIEQWVSHGYKPSDYPGMGYAEVPSAALTVYRASGKVPKEAVDRAIREEREAEAAYAKNNNKPPLT